MRRAARVNLGRLFHDRVHRQPPAAFIAAKKTTVASRVTSDPAYLFHREQNHVGVAIEPHLPQALHMTRLLALAPKPVARTRPVDRPSTRRRLLQGLAVHPRHHQHATTARLLRNGRHQAVGRPLDLIEPRGVHRDASSLPVSRTSRPLALRPPWVNTSQRGASPGAFTCLASIATTMHCEPKRAAASRTNSGLDTAAVLIATLSAPALSRRRMSAVVRMPPPTVSGMKTCPATSSTTWAMVSRPSWLAVMSRNTSSSAPCSS